MFGFEDAAILLVEDMRPVEFIYNNLGGTAVCHRVQRIFNNERVYVGRVHALICGPIENLAVLLIGHMQAVGAAESQRDAVAAVHPAHLEMVAAS